MPPIIVALRAPVRTACSTGRVEWAIVLNAASRTRRSRRRSGSNRPPTGIGRPQLVTAGRYDLLDEATQDRIHQPVRAEIFAGLNPIMAAAKQGGAAASFLSGAGSTVAAFTNQNTERVARLMTQAAIAAGFSGRSIITKPTPQGAHIVETR